MRASARLSVRPIPESDFELYDRVLPERSMLLDAMEIIPWEHFDTRLQNYYSSSKEGQPEYPPLILLKLELLAYLFTLSRARTLERATSDLHWKYFLGLPIDAQLPRETTLHEFRKRLGVEGFTKMFEDLLAVARDEGLISDRVRLKDATHIYANVAIPTALGLFAHLRDRMLAAIRKFDPAAADLFELDAQTVREKTVNEKDDDRLAARVALVEDLLAWIIQQPKPDAQDASAAQTSRQKHWQAMQSIGELAAKILADLAKPDQGDKTRSVADPDCRRGKHGEYYDGYMLDMLMDPKSELVTALNVLPANGAEARDAIDLIAAEEQAQGNDIEELSIDGIGFDGEVLRNLSNPEGPAVAVFTPPKAFSGPAGFPSSEFEPVDEGTRVKCPAGEVSGVAGRKTDKPNMVFFVFSKQKCVDCPLLAACQPNFNPAGRSGRRVSKNEYEPEYEHARKVAQSERYAQVRSIHPAIERKLNEFVRHHGGRRARHRGRDRVLIEKLMTGFAINLKRMVKLLGGQRAPIAACG